MTKFMVILLVKFKQPQVDCLVFDLIMTDQRYEQI